MCSQTVGRCCILLRETFSDSVTFTVINKYGKWCHSDFSTVWSHLPCCLSKGPLKQDFLDIYVTTFFLIRKFGNTSALRVILFRKCAKLYLHFKNAEKSWEKSFCFSDNCIWIGCVNLSLLRTENLWPAFNVFTNSPKVLYITKRDFFQLNYLHSDQ